MSDNSDYVNYQLPDYKADMARNVAPDLHPPGRRFAAKSSGIQYFFTPNRLRRRGIDFVGNGVFDRNRGRSFMARRANVDPGPTVRRGGPLEFLERETGQA